MVCTKCNTEVMLDSLYCMRCGSFILAPHRGTKANLFARWVAWGIDFALWFVVIFLGFFTFFLVPLAYFIIYLVLLSKGKPLGKMILGLRVISSQTGEEPGFGKMFLREVIGRFLSGLFFGLGYFWAIFDKNSQAWHDKLAGTLVVNRGQGDAAQRIEPAPKLVSSPEPQLVSATEHKQLATPVESTLKVAAPIAFSTEVLAKLDILKKRIDKASLNPQFYLELAEIYYDHNLHAEALLEYQKALSLDSSLVDAQIKSANIYLARGEAKKAEGAFAVVVGIRPDLVEAKKGLFRSFQAQENVEQALQLGEEVSKLEPNNIEIHEQLKTLYVKAKNFSAATQHLEILQALKPDDQDVVRELAKLYEESGDDNKALLALENLVGRNENDHDSHVSLARIYCLRKEYSKCIELLKAKVSRMSGRESALAHMYLAHSYGKQGQFEEALTHLFGTETLEPAGLDIHDSKLYGEVCYEVG